MSGPYKMPITAVNPLTTLLASDAANLAVLDEGQNIRDSIQTAMIAGQLYAALPSMPKAVNAAILKQNAFAVRKAQAKKSNAPQATVYIVTWGTFSSLPDYTVSAPL